MVVLPNTATSSQKLHRGRTGCPRHESRRSLAHDRGRRGCRACRAIDRCKRIDRGRRGCRAHDRGRRGRRGCRCPFLGARSFGRIEHDELPFTAVHRDGPQNIETQPAVCPRLRDGFPELDFEAILSQCCRAPVHHALFVRTGFRFKFAKTGLRGKGRFLPGAPHGHP